MKAGHIDTAGLRGVVRPVLRLLVVRWVQVRVEDYIVDRRTALPDAARVEMRKTNCRSM